MVAASPAAPASTAPVAPILPRRVAAIKPREAAPPNPMEPSDVPTDLAITLGFWIAVAALSTRPSAAWNLRSASCVASEYSLLVTSRASLKRRPTAPPSFSKKLPTRPPVGMSAKPTSASGTPMAVSTSPAPMSRAHPLRPRAGGSSIGLKSFQLVALPAVGIAFPPASAGEKLLQSVSVFGFSIPPLSPRVAHQSNPMLCGVSRMNPCCRRCHGSTERQGESSLTKRTDLL